MSDAPAILIAGAGIGGLTAALALSARGFNGTVLEQASAPGNVGAGIQLSANAMHVLDRLGIAEQVKELATEPHSATLRDASNGHVLLNVPLRPHHAERYRQPYLHIHRADLHQILLQALSNSSFEVRFNSAVRGVEQSDGRVYLQTTGQQESADFVIAADGINSVLRQAVFPEVQPVFTRQVAWRGLIDAASVPENLIPDSATVWMGPGKHFVTYYVRGKSLINFVAVEQRNTWTEQSWNRSGDVDQLRASFSDFDERIKTLLKGCRQTHLWGLFDHAPLKQWYKQRVVFLGDACHPMLPFMAQGAAMAIEDAWVLAEEVALQSDSVERAFVQYQNRRQKRVRQVHQISSDNARLYHTESAIGRWIRRLKLGAAQNLPGVTNKRMDSIYAIDVTTERA